MTFVTGLLAGLAAALLLAPRPGAVFPVAPSPRVDAPARVPGGLPPPLRVLLSAAAGAGVWVFLGGALGVVLALPVVVAGWRVLGRVEPSAVRRRREQAARDLPHLVGLLASGLRSGSPPETALANACAALPGPAAESLHPVRSRLALGVDPAAVWAGLVDDRALAPLGRALARGHETGASVVDTVEDLATSLAAEARAGVEDRARAVGVRAAVPLGLCLLPAFLLLGIVPLVAGLAAQLGAG